MKEIKISIHIFIFTILFVSCEIIEDEGYQEYPVIETETINFSGDWYIIGYLDDGSIAGGGDYNLFSTYNTTSNDENFWINDYGAFFGIETVVQVQSNSGSLTFAGIPNSDELITGGTVTVSNGKILKDQGRSTTNRVTDSIYFEVEFDWDPGIIYTFGGHKRTGFLEDENPTHN